MATPEDLRVQYVELNNRSRWYTSQAWQIPFAYLAIVNVTIGVVVAKEEKWLAIALFALAFIGVFVAVQSYLTIEGIRRAVDGMQKLEDQLALPWKAQNTGNYWPLTILLFIVPPLLFIAGVWVAGLWNRQGLMIAVTLIGMALSLCAGWVLTFKVTEFQHENDPLVKEGFTPGRVRVGWRGVGWALLVAGIILSALPALLIAPN